MQLANYYNNPLHSDITIILKSGKIYCHKIILDHVEFFSVGFDTANSSVVKFEDFEDSVVIDVIKSIYCVDIWWISLSGEHRINCLRFAMYLMAENIVNNIESNLNGVSSELLIYWGTQLQSSVFIMRSIIEMRRCFKEGQTTFPLVETIPWSYYKHFCKQRECTGDFLTILHIDYLRKTDVKHLVERSEILISQMEFACIDNNRLKDLLADQSIAHIVPLQNKIRRYLKARKVSI